MIINLFIAGHLFGDFYFQSDKTEKEKKTSIKALLIHCCIYGLSIMLLTLLFVVPEKIAGYFGSILIIVLLHFLIDFCKCKISRKKTNKIIVFGADQLMHIMAILLVYRCMNLAEAMSIKLSQINFDFEKHRNILLLITLILVCATPASVLIKNVFNSVFQENEDDNENGSAVEPKAGSLIGILEREIILVLGIMGQFSAIGFVLAAKSIARYKQLEDKKFAEKYLVGTLLSVFIAVACICGYNYFHIK